MPIYDMFTHVLIAIFVVDVSFNVRSPQGLQGMPASSVGMQGYKVGQLVQQQQQTHPHQGQQHPMSPANMSINSSITPQQQQQQQQQRTMSMDSSYSIRSACGGTMWAGNNTATYTGQMNNTSGNFCELRTFA